MNIISNYSKDTKTKKKVPGSYEWWYFDAQSADGYKIVVIFFEGNPFSRRYIQALENGISPKAEQYPAISISVYKCDQPIYYSFREVDTQSADFLTDLPTGCIENNRFEGEVEQMRVEYSLYLDQTLPNGDSIKADLRFITDLQSKSHFPVSDSVSATHEWNLVMPLGHVHGSIRISGYYEEEIEFNGLGYHDHNLGFEPLKESFTEWYWGRYHLEDFTFVYYVMNKKDSWQNKAWLIDKRGGVEVCENVEMSNYGLSLFGLKTARVIQAQAGKSKIYVQLDETLETGPFYQRFGGRLLMSSGEGVDEARGISEYIKPGRIFDKKFWPLVNMRIAYPGEQHWVQKSPILYRWTW